MVFKELKKMKTSLKYAITLCLAILIIPTTHCFYLVLNLQPTDNYQFIYYYLIALIFIWIITAPILLMLADKAAYQIALSQFKKIYNDSNSEQN